MSGTKTTTPALTLCLTPFNSLDCTVVGCPKLVNFGEFGFCLGQPHSVELFCSGCPRSLQLVRDAFKLQKMGVKVKQMEGG
jgi:hypothetical protein